MASKELRNPIEIRALVQTNPNGDIIEWVKACYTVCCEHEINENRMLVLTETQGLANAINDLVEEAVDQVNTYEGM